MRLAVVPTEIRSGILAMPVRVPVLPASVLARPNAWGQAGTHAGWTRRGRQCVWLDVTDAEAAEIAATPSVTMLGRSGPDAETQRLRRALTEEAAPRVGKPWAARDEFVASYRDLAKACEDAETRREALVRLGKLAMMWGIPILTTALLRGWCPEWLFGAGGAQWALVVLHQDTFDRSNRALNGDTASDGLCVWTAYDGTNPQIVSNKAESNTTGARVAYDSVMSSVDVQRSSATLTASGAVECGVVTRVQNTTDYYSFDHYSGTGYVLKWLSGAPSVLTSGGTLASGDVMHLDSSGSSHVGTKNGGTSVVGPTTDASYATGRAGLYFYTSGCQLDDWSVEIEGAAPATAHFLTLLGVGG